VAIIPHGVGEGFRRKGPARPWPAPGERPIECLYVSPVWRFKHQWHVVRAIAALRERGHDLRLTLVGDGEADMIEKLRGVMAEVDPAGSFITYRGPVPHSDLPAMTQEADVFLMASSCENMPNTLIEGMAAGLPIASSDRGPMPEVVQDGAVMFDPESPPSIAAAIELILNDAGLRQHIAERAYTLAAQYSWSRCAQQSFTFLASVATDARGLRRS
jgi:glycosyltransferase involved in cell wall biosynthesis